MTLLQKLHAVAEDTPQLTAEVAFLNELLHMLDRQGYRHVTVTPRSHAAVIARPDRQVGKTLTDIFGWNLPFEAPALPTSLLDRAMKAGVIAARGDGLLLSRVRVSSVGALLFVHGSFPTDAQDSVFLGPDSYRFANFILDRIGQLQDGATILDYGAGAGVGGIIAARSQRDAKLILADANPRALTLAGINANHAGLDAECRLTTSPDQLGDLCDLIVMHPPFMIDSARRTYRDGGDLWGARVALDWIIAALPKLKIGGRLMMHTGVSVVGGIDPLRSALNEAIGLPRYRVDYRELDPDIFGEELTTPEYADVDRIAAVGVVITREF